jgi:DNA-binding MarR family transcriptional regulator
MAPRYWTDLVKRLGESDAGHLAKMLRGKRYDAELRVTDVARELSVTQPAATYAVRRLLKARVIERTRAEGKSVFYGVRDGDLTVALSLR